MRMSVKSGETVQALIPCRWRDPLCVFCGTSFPSSSAHRFKRSPPVLVSSSNSNVLGRHQDFHSTIQRVSHERLLSAPHGASLSYASVSHCHPWRRPHWDIFCFSPLEEVPNKYYNFAREGVSTRGLGS